MPLHFPAEAPLAETWDLVKRAKEDPTGVETVDLAFWLGGCWHATLRGGSTPLVFGASSEATLPTGEVIADLTDDEVLAACENHLPVPSFAAAADGEPSQAIPWQIIAPLVFELVLRILRRRSA
jgi:hypothetical protein